jgi:hypothetical protein
LNYIKAFTPTSFIVPALFVLIALFNRRIAVVAADVRDAENRVSSIVQWAMSSIGVSPGSSWLARFLGKYKIAACAKGRISPSNIILSVGYRTRYR